MANSDCNIYSPVDSECDNGNANRRNRRFLAKCAERMDTSRHRTGHTDSTYAGGRFWNKVAYKPDPPRFYSKPVESCTTGSMADRADNIYSVMDGESGNCDAKRRNRRSLVKCTEWVDTSRYRSNHADSAYRICDYCNNVACGSDSTRFYV
jgi:hypothetical protein